jgi:hypothetical protein
MPKQIKNINWPFQRTVHQHPEFFNNVGLLKEWCKSQQKHKRDEELIVKQIIHCFYNPLPHGLTPIIRTTEANPACLLPSRTSRSILTAWRNFSPASSCFIQQSIF